IQRGADIAVIVLARMILFYRSKILIVGHHCSSLLSDELKKRTAVATNLRLPLVIGIVNRSADGTLAAIGVDETAAVLVCAIRTMSLTDQRVCLIDSVGTCQKNECLPDRIVASHCVLILRVAVTHQCHSPVTVFSAAMT